MTHRLSPALRHKQRVLAALKSGAGASIGIPLSNHPSGANDDAPEGPATLAYRQMQLQLIDHQRSLKAIMSTEGKVALKREILPLYQDWVSGVLAGSSDSARGAYDEVLVMVMIWRMDVGDFAGAMPLIEYVLHHGMPLPNRFKSTPAVFITDTICDAALKAYVLGDETAAAFPSGILGHLEDLVEDIDMHDEVRAKLQKAIGKAILTGGDEAERRARAGEALKRYLRALDLDDRVGLKKDIDSLQRELKRSEPGNELSADEPPAEQSAPELAEQNSSDTPSDDG